MSAEPTAAFQRLLNRLQGQCLEPDQLAQHDPLVQQNGGPRPLLDPRAPISVARAPGRLDVMGGIADYSGALALEMPLSEATFAACQSFREHSSNTSEDQRLQIVSLPLGSAGPSRVGSFEWRDLDALRDYPAARDYFASAAAGKWSAYAAGVALLLRREHGLPNAGMTLIIASNLPEGKGVASSAAIEVAVMTALNAHFGLGLDARQIALECQRVENLIVGAPCGVMDQLTSSAGHAGELLEILCQPASIEGSTRLPDGLEVWGIDSGLRHEVSGADYGQVRVAAFMGYRIIAGWLGLEVSPSAQPDHVDIQDDRYGGYLANIDVSEFDQNLEARLPREMMGAAFIEKYQGISDPVTRIDPERLYPVAAATAHPVREHARVTRFRELLRLPVNRQRCLELGELMYQSHTSYSACGLGSRGTDSLVQLVRSLGPTHGLFGAKITGGGSGGTVAVLGRREAQARVRDVVQQYAEASGHEPYVFTGSSPGATDYGVQQLLFAHGQWAPAPQP